MQVHYPLPHRLTAEIEIKDDQTGEKIIFPAQSFVLNFINILYVQISSVSLANVTDTGGTLRTINAASTALNCNRVANASDYGIVVGTGTNAVALTDTKLQTLITTGVGAGQLSYGATSFTMPVTSGNDRYFEVIRSFSNSSGADITVNEIGIYCNNTAFNFCFERSLNTFTITNGGSKTVTYRIKVTV